MEEKFLENLEIYLLNDNFYKINNNINKNIYFKNIGPNGYIVIPILKEEKYNEIFDNIEKFSYNILTQNNMGKIFIVRILIGKNFSQEDELFFCEQVEMDKNVVNINWGVDLLENNMIIKQSQPSKFLNIENHIKSSLFGKAQSIKKKYIISKNCYFTYTLMTAITLVYIIIFIFSKKNIAIYNFGVSPSLFSDKETYRLFTFLFLHSGLTHLLSNLLSLYIFGTRIEKYLGKTAFLLIFFIGGFASGIFSVIFTKTYSIGASGAIFALESATLYFSIKEKIKLDGLDYYTIGLMAIIGIIGSFLYPNIDNAGHIGGFLVGFLVCFIYYNTAYKYFVNKIDKQ